MGRPLADRPYPIPHCAFFSQLSKGSIVPHGILRLTRGTFWNIFTAAAAFFSLLALLTRVRWRRQGLIPRFAAARQQLVTEAQRFELLGLCGT